MTIIQYLAIAAALICICGLLIHFIRVIRLGKPNDLSEKSGDTTQGIVYSNTVAMLPQNKESAYLHIPSYAVGMLFHIGTFISLLIFILSFFPFFNQWIAVCNWHHIFTAGIAVTTICGLILFFKRLTSKSLQALSNPDDYISNAFVTLFQLFTTLYLAFPMSGALRTIYYIICILLCLYMPLGKLRHVIFYFAARYHIGFFYGWRNVWPKREVIENTSTEK